MSAPRGVVLWLTGLPAAGKTTVARLLVEALRSRDVAHLWLDSDALRSLLTPLGGFDAAQRDVFYGALGQLAVAAAEGGVFVVVSATASQRRYRDAVRGRVEHFVEVYLRAAPEILRARDPKGLYRQAASGEVQNLPGVDAAYEAPEAAALELESDRATPAELVDVIVRHLAARSFL